MPLGGMGFPRVVVLIRPRPLVPDPSGPPEDPEELLAGHARVLDDAYRQVANGLDSSTPTSVDELGKLHLSALEAIDEPASLVELRNLVRAMLTRVGLPELILEVMSWQPGFVGAFTAVSGGRTRLSDLHVTIAACLAAHAMNIGFEPIVKHGIAALERGRISHVDQNYLGAESYQAANPFLVHAQAGIPLAGALGGRLVAGIDGMRFIVPIPSIYARPNRKYFGPDRGVTWLNMLSDQAVGLAGKVISGAPRDSMHMIDLAFSQDQGQRPEVIVADTGSYSDLVFGLCRLLTIEYRPELADMPDQRGWRTKRHADYGPLDTVARGIINLPKIRRHWPDILRIAASIYTGRGQGIVGTQNRSKREEAADRTEGDELRTDRAGTQLDNVRWGRRRGRRVLDRQADLQQRRHLLLLAADLGRAGTPSCPSHLLDDAARSAVKRLTTSSDHSARKRLKNLGHGHTRLTQGKGQGFPRITSQPLS
jgi:hypothetical protein